VKIIHPVICCITLALTAGASAAPAAEDDFPLNGSYTQNIPCKGDGSDPPKLQLKISTQQIDSKVGICTFLDTKRNGKTLTHILNAGFPPDRSSATSPSPYSPTIRSNSLIATRTIARSFIAVRSNRPEVPPCATPSLPAGH
jgi:hypothetical protein